MLGIMFNIFIDLFINSIINNYYGEGPVPTTTIKKLISYITTATVHNYYSVLSIELQTYIFINELHYIHHFSCQD